jgi:hypothetical protein
VRLALELVGKRVQRLGLASARVCERPGEEEVGHPGVPWQERAVKIRPERAAEATALVARRPVIAVARDDPAER